MASDPERCWRCHREPEYYYGACEGCLHGMVDWAFAAPAALLRQGGPLYSIGEGVLCWWRRRQIRLGVY